MTNHQILLAIYISLAVSVIVIYGLVIGFARLLFNIGRELVRLGKLYHD